MIYQPHIEQSDWSEVTSHGTTSIITRSIAVAKLILYLLLSIDNLQVLSLALDQD